MTLKDKIYYCRKKAGLSQETLAEKLGVSRQAVSKWETGEAVPDIDKLPGLSLAFGVSIDWLLSDTEPENVPKEEKAASEPKQEKSYPSWVDTAPGVIGRMVRRFGWLYGVYVAISGALITLIGIIAKVAVKSMFGNNMNSFFSDMGQVVTQPGGYYITDPAGQMIIQGGEDFLYQSGYFNDFVSSNPVSIFASVLIGLGIAVMIVGIVLAIWLKKKSK